MVVDSRRLSQDRGMVPILVVSNSDVVTEDRTTLLTNEGGDHERFAHYVNKNAIVPSSVEGTPLVALCGKKWIPSRDPSRFPVCPECKEIYESLMK